MTLNLYKDLYKTVPYASLEVPMLPPKSMSYPNPLGDNSCVKTEILKKGATEGTTQVMATVYGGPCLNISTSDLEISGARLPLPQPSEEQYPDPLYLYTEGGCRFHVFYKKSGNTLQLLITVADVYTDIENDDTHDIEDNFQSVKLYESAWGRPLVGAGSSVIAQGPTTDNSYLEIDTTNFTNIRVYVYETITTFKKTTDPPFEYTGNAFFFLVVADAISTGQKTLISSYPACYSSNIITASDLVPQPEPGQNGYNPTNNHVGNQVGGRGNGNGVSDPAERFDLAARNAAFSYGGNGKGLTYYDMSATDFYQVMGTIYSRITDLPSAFVGGDLDQALDIAATLYDKTSTTRECIATAFQIPFNPVSVATQTVRVGFVGVNTSGTGVITERILHVGDFQLNLVGEGWQDYNDIVFTEAILTLPFVGSITIDPAAIAANAGSGGYIEVDVYVDCYNGNIAYWLYLCPMNTPSNVEYLHGVYTGNCAMEIPYAAIANSGDLKGRIRNIGSSIADGAVSVATSLMSGGTSKTSSAALEGFV